MQKTKPNANRTRSLPAVSRAELAQLLADVERYLAAVDAFRAEGYEPTWRAA